MPGLLERCKLQYQDNSQAYSFFFVFLHYVFLAEMSSQLFFIKWYTLKKKKKVLVCCTEKNG